MTSFGVEINPVHSPAFSLCPMCQKEPKDKGCVIKDNFILDIFLYVVHVGMDIYTLLS